MGQVVKEFFSEPLIKSRTEEGMAFRSEILNALSDALSHRIQILEGRWKSEKEDFIHYAEIMKRLVLSACPPNTKFIKAHRFPFGITVEIPEFPYHIQFQSNGWAAKNM
jgi:hypothetical protein